MTPEEYSFRLRVGRFFAPFGMAVALYYLVHFVIRDHLPMIIFAGALSVSLTATTVLLFSTNNQRIESYIRRSYGIHSRAAIFAIGAGTVAAVAVTRSLEFVPWTFLYPYLAISLVGVREARWWVTCHASVLFSTLFGLVIGRVSPDVDVLMGATAVAAYVAAFSMSSIIDSARRKSLATVLQQKEQLSESFEQLEVARNKAETANRSKSEFLANMSHELRTPLNHIIGFTELVADGRFGEVNPAQKEHLGDVLKSSSHLLSLINDVLDISKVEAGRMELELHAIDTAAFFDDAVRIISDTAASGEVKVILEVGQAPVSIVGDERKLKQVIYNLMSNAVKFAHGGTVTLRARPGPTSDESEPMRGHLVVSVTDSGIGLRPEDLGRVFEPFERVATPARQQKPGTGLGLSVSRRIVELHGGRLWAESQGPGHGSTFVMDLPVGGPAVD